MIIDEELTEYRWLAAADFDAAAWMIRRIWQDTPYPSVRKSQLFAYACARQVWPFMPDENCRRAVDIAEKFIEGLATRQAAESAAIAAMESYRTWDQNTPQFWAGVAAAIAAYPRADRYSDWKSDNALRCVRACLGHGGLLTSPVQIVRDIFGNPFHSVSVQPSLRTPDVVTLAGHIYHDRAFSVMPQLADALLDAGCEDDDLLSHVRSNGPHVRGCWVVDLLLGKN
jgi:hypothetical protein